MSKAILFVTAATLVMSSCRKTTDISAPDAFVNFETAAQGIGANESSINIKIKLSSAAAADIPVVLNVTEAGVEAGTDYTTTPSVNAGKIHLIIPSGNNEASFTLTKVPGKLFDGTERIIFDIYSSGNSAIIGISKQLTLNFAELVATNTSLQVNGGGLYFPNKVFIDISAERQTAVNRNSWDLGFYSGAEYRVILNSSLNMMVKQINKNDLTAVSASDTIGITSDLGFSQSNPAASQMPYFDYPNGDLTRTAIAEVSATAADNKVYIVNRGNGVGSPAPERGWRKIRVIRNSSGGYTLQHAAIDATTFTSVSIPKDPNYYFSYASFETGALSVEPEKSKWDIAWTYFANVFNLGGEVPYLFQDAILLNRGVSVATVVTTVTPISFDAFTATDIAGLTFKTTQNAIASDWRSGGGPTTAPAVKTDRYYIIKDGNANYYKLKFTALSNGNGERGYPAYSAVWLKKD